MVEVFRKYDGSGEDRSGQWPPSGFVSSCLDKVRMKIIQQLWFIAHSAKIHNLLFPIKPFLQHADDFVLASDGFFLRFYKILEIANPPFKVIDAS